MNFPFQWLSRTTMKIHREKQPPRQLDLFLEGYFYSRKILLASNDHAKELRLLVPNFQVILNVLRYLDEPNEERSLKRLILKMILLIFFKINNFSMITTSIHFNIPPEKYCLSSSISITLQRNNI